MLYDPVSPREGELYKRLEVAGYTFELRYGYYEERERALTPPVVIFPDLASSCIYSAEGFLLVTQVQDACRYYIHSGDSPERWCGDCLYYRFDQPEIGICQCLQNNNTSLGGMENENETVKESPEHPALPDAAG